MSKESLQAGLGVRFHGKQREEQREAETVRPARRFEPEGIDLARLLPKLHGRVRRMR